MEKARELFRQALLGLDESAAEELFCSAMDGSVFVAVEALLVPVLDRMGTEWERGELSLAQIYMAGRICEALTERYLPPQAAGAMPQVAVANLLDHHALGRRMVLAALHASGIPAADYGAGLSVAEVVAKVVAERPRVLLLSTLMLGAALAVREVRAGLDAAGCSTKLAVGGAPFRFDPELAVEVGADATGRTATDAVRLVRELLKGGEA